MFQARVQEWDCRREASRRRNELAREQQEAQEVQECTFHPMINGKSDFYARRSRGCFAEPLAERLHHEADRRASLRSKAKELLEVDEVCACSFRPQINPSDPTKEAARTPIHLRAGEVLQARGERIREAQVAEDMRTDCNFRPKISARSSRLVQQRRDRLYRAASQGCREAIAELGPVEDRLYNQALAQGERRAELSGGAASGLGQPSLDGGSRRLCESSVYFQGAQSDFLSRQQTFEQARQRRMEVRSQHAAIKCPFRPRISDTSYRIAAVAPDLLGETPEDRLHRLAVKDVERREQVKAALDQFHHRECTFTPEISAASRAIAAGATPVSEDGTTGADGSLVHERLYRSATSRSRGTAESRVDEAEEECSFQPHLDPRSVRRYSHVKPHYSADAADIMATIRRERQKQAELMAERRREQEEEECVECTFTPETSRPYKEARHPVVVNGLGRYFELRNLAQRKEQQRRDREARVFRKEVSKSICSGVTIPEPFELSSSVRKDRSRAMSPRDECTFTPHTNESENRAVIQELMGCALADVLAEPCACDARGCFR